MIPFDYVEKLMQVDATVGQDFDRMHRAEWGNVSSEELLMKAVLEDALNALDGKITAGTYSVSPKKPEDPLHEAMEWVLSEEDDYVFSFVVICQKFRIDPWAARAAIVKKYGMEKKRAA